MVQRSSAFWFHTAVKLLWLFKFLMCHVSASLVSLSYSVGILLGANFISKVKKKKKKFKKSIIQHKVLIQF